MSAISPDDPTTRNILRHLLATIAYRAGKAIRDTPDAFGQYRQTPESPTSAEIVAHMGDLMEWVLRLSRAESKFVKGAVLPWDQEVARLYRLLKAVDDELASDKASPLNSERVLQGPIADALTHVGQLAMLRRLSGHPMKGESYARAEIVIGRVGPDQTPPA